MLSPGALSGVGDEGDGSGRQGRDRCGVRGVGDE